MLTRTLALVACVMTIAALGCGGDEPSGPACMGTEMSVPNGPNDPCRQDDPQCVAAGGKAYAMCQNGAWPASCMCITPNNPPLGTGTTQQPVTQGPNCGDNMITVPEQCDRTNLNGADCKTLGFTGGGTLLCNPTTCSYDTIMCRMTVGTSGGAGMSGGAGTTGGGAGTGR